MRTRWALVVLLALAAFLRLMAADGELLVDEIRSLDLASGLAHALQAFGVLDDDNHVLTTIWLAWLGPHHTALAYRSLSVLTGMVAVCVAIALVPRVDVIGRLLTAALFASSLLLVTYASEARGFAPALACVLLSLWVLERRFERPLDLWLVPLFWLLTALALLCHSSVGPAYVALACYGLVRKLRVSPPRNAWLELARMHAVPLALLVAWYAFFVRRTKLGGDDLGLTQLLGTTAAWTLGVPADSSTRAVALAIVVCVTALGIATLVRARDPRAALFATGIGLPVLLVVAMGAPHAGPRHLLSSVAFFTLLVGSLASRWIARGGGFRIAIGGFVAWVVALNLAGDIDLLRVGRGDYGRVIAFVLAHSPPGRVTLSSDDDILNRMLLGHFAREHADARRIAYVTLPSEAADWLILHRDAWVNDVLPEHLATGGQFYDKWLSLPCAMASGTRFEVYVRRR